MTFTRFSQPICRETRELTPDAWASLGTAHHSHHNIRHITSSHIEGLSIGHDSHT